MRPRRVPSRQATQRVTWVYSSPVQRWEPSSRKATATTTHLTFLSVMDLIRSITRVPRPTVTTPITPTPARSARAGSHTARTAALNGAHHTTRTRALMHGVQQSQGQMAARRLVRRTTLEPVRMGPPNRARTHTVSGEVPWSQRVTNGPRHNTRPTPKGPLPATRIRPVPRPLQVKAPWGAPQLARRRTATCTQAKMATCTRTRTAVGKNMITAHGPQ